MAFPLVALVLAVFSLGTAESIIAGLLPVLSADLQVSVPQAGLLVTAYALTVVFAGPVLTLVTSRVPRKPLLIGLTALFAAGNVLAALAPDYRVLLVARVLSALTHCTLFALALIMATSLVPKEQSGSAVAKVLIGVNLATVLGVPLGVLIADRLDWRATFWCVAVLSAVATLAAVLTVKDVPAGGSAASELRVLGDRRVQAALVVTGLGMAGAFTAFTYLTPLFTEVTGLDANAISLMLVIFGIGSCVGGWVGGKLADRALMPATTAVLGVLVLVLLVFAGVASSAWLSGVLVFTFGVVFFALNPLMGARIIGLASTGAPTLAIAVSVSSVQIAIAFGGWFGGWVIDAGFGTRAVVIAGAVVTALGGVLSYRELHKHKKTLVSS